MLYIYMYLLALLSVVVVCILTRVIYITFERFNSEYNELNEVN